MTIPVHGAQMRFADPATLQSNPVNPKRHGGHEFQFLVGIIHERGWRDFVIVSKR
jgi:hypothetical protein